MKRGSLFFIGLLSAIITVVSLNFALGNRFGRYPYYRGYYRCYDRYDDRYRDKDKYYNDDKKADSLNSNY